MLMSGLQTHSSEIETAKGEKNIAEILEPFVLSASAEGNARA